MALIYCTEINSIKYKLFPNDAGLVPSQLFVRNLHQVLLSWSTNVGLNLTCITLSSLYSLNQRRVYTFLAHPKEELALIAAPRYTQHKHWITKPSSLLPLPGCTHPCNKFSEARVERHSPQPSTKAAVCVQRQELSSCTPFP